jgi:hypothetical protein
MFKSNNEKIYKFVYKDDFGYHAEKKTMLLTGCTPVQAVKAFNKRAGNKLIDIIEFIEVVPKVEEG